ncbi:MAG: tetratricopeptide repeat protein [Desulfuromonadales bacterium]|nr:tetratricopeptide repeat protein [Desulfuromonadales bacterium]
MSFLKKMFAKKDPVEEMRQLHARKDWAGVLRASRQLERDELAPALNEEISAWECQAGDALSAINLDEGAWAQESGNLLRAREDYQLAIELARSSGLRERAEQALASLDRGELPQEAAETSTGPAIHAGCNSSCATTTGAAVTPQKADLDEETRLELLLATMPAELAERYLTAGPEFRQAWLMAQDGEEQQALTLLNQIPKAERNSLFLFERGALMARSGQHKKAYQDLQAALTAEPGLFPAFDTLIDVLITSGRTEELEKTLKQTLAAGRFTGYCWARLAELHAQRSELELALAAGLKALEEGITDAGLISLCAQLLERAERVDEAEALLMRMPSGGCGGGAHPMLAELWLRRDKNLDRALESFKAALRQERDNPRWLLRIAQVYLAKGWRKQAAEQIERLMRQGELPEPVRVEVKAMADQLQNN